MSRKTINGYDCGSFDRFGDDLCEHLLSYLSVRDKIHFECVSKQWKRLIFNKQNMLIISYLDGLNYTKKERRIHLLTKSYVWYTQNQLKIPSLSLVILFKKFKFINDILFHPYLQVTNELLEVITNNCLYLRKCIFSTINLGENCLKNFGLKRGHNLKYFSIHGINDRAMQKFLEFTPYVETVLVSNSIKPYNEQYLSKLETIKISLDQDISEFADKYHKQIKKIVFRKEEKCVIKMPHILEQLLRFENLISLHIFVPDFSVHWLTHLKNLKSLEIEHKCIFDDKYFEGLKLLHLTKLSIISFKLTDKVLPELCQMKNLLELQINSWEMTNSGVCQLIKSSPQLKTFRLASRYINETTIEAIIEKANINPKIQYKLVVISFDALTRLKRIDNKYIPKNLIIIKWRL